MVVDDAVAVPLLGEVDWRSGAVIVIGVDVVVFDVDAAAGSDAQ